MIRWIVGHAFLRWGLPGALLAVLCIVWLAWWLVSALWWLVSGALWVLGMLAGLGYLLVIVAAVAWLRRRRESEHLLNYGRRRRWLD